MDSFGARTEVSSPGSNVGPNSEIVVTVNEVVPTSVFRSDINFTLGTMGNGFIGLIGGDAFHRGTSNPDVNSAVASSNTSFYLDNFGALSYLNGAQEGDDNWMYITSNTGAKSWAQFSFTSGVATLLRYVHDPACPEQPISLPAAYGVVNGTATAPRDVQFKSIDFENGIVELFNYGPLNISLSGWRFCTHDEDQTKRYSASAGLNGVTIEAGTSLYIHYNNDAPGGGTADRLNISAIGGNFATPLDSGGYGLNLYFPPISFGNGSTMADHLQWSVSGVDDTSADDRSDEAQNGGVWTDQSTWIPTSTETTHIYLTDPDNGRLHGPTDYLVVPDFTIISVDYALPAGDFTILFPDIRNLVVEVQKNSGLSPGGWSPVQTTSHSSAFLTGQFDLKAFYRLAPKIP
ncbi:MAG: hypothetical protein AAF591_01300 [Verrucomicrobiota bacterium]